ncbi:repeat outer membrane protein [Anaeramoeba ignava]|uniref:Repeat outer membrane protein n=1 Tax=Anaeramoeba ignava TaxID=1746090 RepID=A0A9Q0R8Y9_ANAIG|nr:repeat outer membrane protein [Anaeramoeba ignava]
MVKKQFIYFTLILFFQIIFLNFKINCNLPFPENCTFDDPNTYYLEAGKEYNFSCILEQGTDITILCKDYLNETTLFYVDIMTEAGKNIFFDMQNCGPNLTFGLNISVDNFTNLNFSNVYFNSSARISANSSSLNLNNCSINGTNEFNEDEYFIETLDSTVVIEMLNNPNPSSFPNLLFKQEFNITSEVTVTYCDENFNFTLDGIQTILTNCTPLELTINNTHLTLADNYSEINNLIIDNSDFTISDLVVRKLSLYGNSSISAPFVNVNESLFIYGSSSDSKGISTYLYFNGTVFASEETEIEIKNRLTISSSACNYETTNLTFLVNNGVLEINNPITIKEIEFNGLSSLNGTGSLQILDFIHFTETGDKIISASLKILNLSNSETSIPFDGFVLLYSDFFINTSLDSVMLPSLKLVGPETNLKLYSEVSNTNYTVPFLRIDGGSITGNETNFLLVEDKTNFYNYSVINYIQIDSNETSLFGIGSINFQNSARLYTSIANSESGSNFNLFGSGFFTTELLNVEGNLSFDGILNPKNIEIKENAILEGIIEEYYFSSVNVTLNGSFIIKYSSLDNVFDSFICYSQNSFPLTLINSDMHFGENQFALPPLKMTNSIISNFSSILQGLFLEGSNSFIDSSITFENGLIQSKEYAYSFLDLNSTTLNFDDYSGLNLSSSSSLRIFSSDYTTLNLFYDGVTNSTFSVSNDSSLKLENIRLEVNGDSVLDLNGTILVNGSYLRIYNFNYKWIGNLEIINSSSEVYLESSLKMKNLSFSQGKLTFDHIHASDYNSSLIFGDGKSEDAIVNENKATQATIYSLGYIEINNNTVFNKIGFDIQNGSLVINGANLTDPSYQSNITNQGEIKINPNIAHELNEKQDGGYLDEESSDFYIDFSVQNQGGIIRCYQNVRFIRMLTSSGIIETSNNLTFENGLDLWGTGKIQGLWGEKPNIFINESLYMHESSQIEFFNIYIDKSFSVSGSTNKSIIDSNLTAKSFYCDFGAQFHLNGSIATIQEDYFFNYECFLTSSTYSYSSEFYNYGNFFVENLISISFDVDFFSYGNISADSSGILFKKLKSYGDFQLNNSNLTLLEDSFLDNRDIDNHPGVTHLTQSIIEMRNGKNMTFLGFFIIEDGLSVLGNFQMNESSNVTLKLKNYDSYLLINEPSSIDWEISLNLLSESEGGVRNEPYSVIKFNGSSNFSQDQLKTFDEQYIEFSEYGDYLIAKVKGCRKGQFSQSFDQKCFPCDNGTYNNQYGAFSCNLCPIGYFSKDKGQEECQPCDPGSYQQERGKMECSLCSQGTFSSQNGSYYCKECPPGQYNTINGSSSCEICGIGNFSDNPTRCEFCPKGTFNPQEGSFLCYPCFMGTYNDLLGQRFCASCGRDSYQDEMGKETCKGCPANSETNVYGASDINDCLCSLGFYGIASEACKTCPTGSVCNDVGIIVPSAEEGYWHSSSDPETFLECSVKEACPGGGSNNCNKELGYSGNLCSVCLKGFYKFGEQCMKCPNNQKNRLIIVGFFIVFLCLFLFIIARKIRNYFASFSIMFSFLQVLAVISGLKLNWPDSIESTWRSISIFNFNIDYLAVECSLSLTYTQKWILCMVFPFILLIVLLLVYFFVFLHSKIIEKCGAGFMRKFPRFCSKPSRKTTNKYLFIFSWLRFKISQLFTHGFGKEQRKSLYNNLINSYSTILSFIYLFLSYKTLQIFDCKKQSEGTYTFGGDPSLFCYEQWWKDIFPWAIACIVLYVFGIPFVLTTFFFVSSKKLDEQTFDLRFGLLCARYTKTWFFWEIFVMIRKLFLTIAQIFLSFDSIIQSVVCVIVLLFALVLQIHAKPFISDRHNTLEFVLICFSEIILFSGMIFVSNDLEQSSARGILATIIVVIIWISFSTLIIMILFEIRHRLRVHKGKDVDEIKESINIASGQTILKFLASNPSFFLVWDWILESSDHKNKLQREFFHQIKEYYDSKETEKQKLKTEQFWQKTLTKWRDSFYVILESWFIQASLQEKIQFINILTKIRFEGLLYGNSNFTQKERRRTRRLSVKYFKKNLVSNPSKNQN